MRDVEALLAILRQSGPPDVVAAIERLIHEAPDADLSRVNVVEFARKAGLDPEQVIAAFLHAARIGLFEMSWNVLCPGCGGVLDASSTLKTLNRDHYNCVLCAAGYEPTLDDMVEATFTVSPRVRKIAAHDPDTLPFVEYFRQVFWGSGFDLPDDLEALLDEVLLDSVELPAGQKAILSLQLPEAFIIVFDPVTHATQFVDVKGTRTRARQSLSLVINRVHATNQAIELSPGPLHLTLDNQSDVRALPGVWVAGDALHELLGRRKPFLTAKRLLSNQTFRDLYRTDTLDIDQRLKIMSLTFLFTDLKGSTALYEKVGDLVAFDLVRSHFRMLTEIVVAEGGAVVKTIGDAVMATFPTPDRAVAAALRMRAAILELDGTQGGEELLLKIGIHEGPCLAVTLNERQDYFGQTVNIAARVQGLAASSAIFTTASVVSDSNTASLLQAAGLEPAAQRCTLRGVAADQILYVIP